MNPPITLIGSGNVAWHLGPALENAGYPVIEIFSREKRNAKALVKRLYNADHTSSLDFKESSSHVFIICIPDDAIEEVAKEIIIPEHAILLHTSGNTEMNILEYSATSNYGVFYPLQTFSKNKKLSFTEIPILLESSNKDTYKIIEKIAKSISENTYKVNSQQRKRVHIAAVFASNFVNHLLSLSEEILRKQNLDFDILKPLIIEQVTKSLNIDPENAQTGPAYRKDFKTLDNHVEILQNEYSEELVDIYKMLTQSIIDHYS